MKLMKIISLNSDFGLKSNNLITCAYRLIRIQITLKISMTSKANPLCNYLFLLKIQTHLYADGFFFLESNRLQDYFDYVSLESMNDFLLCFKKISSSNDNGDSENSSKNTQ